MWRYITDHWYGRQGLAWSLWVNLVLIRLLVSGLQEWASPAKGADFHDHRAYIILLALLFHGGLFVWQAVGVIRASDIYTRQNGALAPVWGAQLALLVSFFWSSAYALDAWRMTLHVPDNMAVLNETNAGRSTRYSFALSADGHSLTLTGSLELGVAQQLKAQLAAHPDVTQIVLASTGGNIYEARGLSETIRQNGLNTLVTTECSSACTTAFVGGIIRQATGGGKLGFHQYRVDATYSVLTADPQREQDRDRKIFLQSDVEPWFVKKMFQSAASDIWYPDISELVAANVVTR